LSTKSKKLFQQPKPRLQPIFFVKKKRLFLFLR
jgi:hypothetical protein